MTTAARQQVTKVAEKAEAEPTDAKARNIPPLKATALEWQFEGHVYREAFVRLPAHVILQDLQDSSGLWRAIQGVPSKALHAFDRVTCVAFNRSWVVKDVLVADADAQGVKLAIRPQDVIRLQAQGGEWRRRSAHREVVRRRLWRVPETGWRGGIAIALLERRKKSPASRAFAISIPGCWSSGRSRAASRITSSRPRPPRARAPGVIDP